MIRLSASIFTNFRVFFINMGCVATALNTVICYVLLQHHCFFVFQLSLSSGIEASILQHLVATECHRQLERCEHEIGDCSEASVRRVHAGQGLMRLSLTTVLSYKTRVFQEMQRILGQIRGLPSKICAQSRGVEIQHRDQDQTEGKRNLPKHGFSSKVLYRR